MEPDPSNFGSLVVRKSLLGRLQHRQRARSASLRPRGLALATCVAAAAGLPAVSWGATGSRLLGRTATPGSLPRVTEYDSLLVSRSDPGTVLLGTQHGLFRTTNGGRSWTPAGLREEAVTSLGQSG